MLSSSALALLQYISAVSSEHSLLYYFVRAHLYQRYNFRRQFKSYEQIYLSLSSISTTPDYEIYSVKFFPYLIQRLTQAKAHTRAIGYTSRQAVEHRSRCGFATLTSLHP